MTRSNLASIPAGDSSPAESLPTAEQVERLIAALESVATVTSAAELELKAFTPEEAAPFLGKTTNWVVENIQDGRIPCTYIGKSPRMTAAHIRWVQANGERKPSKYAKPVKSAA
ncbi:hypothetical protein [Streptomyces asiaticus]|uniref:hypothetical protein n=1 Tax=Streptomyces asiaticus TaxID=114695 RepID=UPI001BACD68E|nr:hypothetical protein [Streptomyces asiaticus]